MELFNYLASPDPELRDAFAYNILARWIILYGYHTPDDLRAMIEWLAANMMLHIGEENTDSVFLRSYSVLILSLIVYRDNRQNFLQENEVRSLFDQARLYFTTERDQRAYVPGKGWANATGHAADLLKFLGRSGYLEAADLLRLLDTIADKLTINMNYVYQHDEDDRLAQATMSVLRRETLTIYELSTWINRFTGWKTNYGGSMEFNPSQHTIYQNVKNYLRSLYCQLNLAPHLQTNAQDFVLELLTVIKVFNL